MEMEMKVERGVDDVCERERQWGFRWIYILQLYKLGLVWYGIHRF